LEKREEKKSTVDVTLVSPAEVGKWAVYQEGQDKFVLSAADRPMREENAESAPY
jgi:hypothetical protein